MSVSFHIRGPSVAYKIEVNAFRPFSSALSRLSALALPCTSNGATKLALRLWAQGHCTNLWEILGKFSVQPSVVVCYHRGCWVLQKHLCCSVPVQVHDSGNRAAWDYCLCFERSTVASANARTADTRVSRVNTNLAVHRSSNSRCSNTSSNCITCSARARTWAVRIWESLQLS